jgi:ATP-dependent exoDNAse (exonuclease V) beta subunit
MTVHASKGLGFHMTILAQMNIMAGANMHQVRSGELGNPPQKYFSIKNLDREDSTKETALWSLLRHDDASREKAELKRQLYVACTRAKEHLVLLAPAASKPDSWGKWIEHVRNTHVLQKFTYEQLMQMQSHWQAETDENKLGELNQVQNSLDGTELPSEISISQLLDYLFPHAEKEIQSAEDTESQQLLIGAKERGSLIHRLLEWDGKSTFTALENLMRFNGLPISDSQSMHDLALAVRAELLQLPFDHKNAKQEFTFILPAAKLRECVGDIEQDERLEEWLAAEDNWCNGIIDYLAPLQSGGYAILDFKTHWNQAAQHSEATQKRIEKQLQLYAVAAKQLGFDVKKLYAMRICGSSGEITLEEIDL